MIFLIHLKILFQSTPPRRRRLSFVLLLSNIYKYFNPRLREGGDSILQGALSSHLIFQSTPPRRRRRNIVSQVRILAIFQSTPPRRRRPHKKKSGVYHQKFQSTPPRRRRHEYKRNEIITEKISIHASAKEATRWRNGINFLK